MELEVNFKYQKQQTPIEAHDYMILSITCRSCRPPSRGLELGCFMGIVQCSTGTKLLLDKLNTQKDRHHSYTNGRGDSC